LSILLLSALSLFSSNHTAPPEIYTLSLHDALPILLPRTSSRKPSKSPGSQFAKTSPPESARPSGPTAKRRIWRGPSFTWVAVGRSEEHTSELQSREKIVCRLLLEKKKKKNKKKNKQ